MTARTFIGLMLFLAVVTCTFLGFSTNKSTKVAGPGCNEAKICPEEAKEVQLPDLFILESASKHLLNAIQ